MDVSDRWLKGVGGFKHLKHYRPVFRRGGIYGAINPRGVTWGRDLVVPDGDRDTYMHEYHHYMQQLRDGWAYMQGKGVYEILFLEQIYNKSPYTTPSTNEYNASYYETFFKRR